MRTMLLQELLDILQIRHSRKNLQDGKTEKNPIQEIGKQPHKREYDITLKNKIGLSIFEQNMLENFY